MSLVCFQNRENLARMNWPSLFSRSRHEKVSTSSWMSMQTGMFLDLAPRAKD